jgi:hypothetical protein
MMLVVRSYLGVAMSKLNVALMIVVLMSVVGCMSGGLMPWDPQPQPTNPSGAAPAPAPAPPPSQQDVWAQQQKDAAAILDRAQAIRTTADTAVQTDGSPQANQVRQMVQGCRGNTDVCIRYTKTLDPKSPVGAFAGLAGYLTQPLASLIFSRSQGVNVLNTMNLQPILRVGPNLDLAEKAANKAMEEARKVADARAEQQKVMDAEAQAISVATDDCAKNEPACKAKCDNDKDGNYCLAWAVRLRNNRTPKLVDARAYFQKSCDAGNQHGCGSIAGVDQQIQAAAAQVEGLWGGVAEVGDDLAAKYHMVSSLAKMAVNSPRLQRDVQKMIVINEAIVTERYCPARKAFIQGVNVADFAKRAADHCKNSPPTGQGLSGAEIALTTECQRVYATACP